MGGIRREEDYLPWAFGIWFLVENGVSSVCVCGFFGFAFCSFLRNPISPSAFSLVLYVISKPPQPLSKNAIFLSIFQHFSLFFTKIPPAETKFEKRGGAYPADQLARRPRLGRTSGHWFFAGRMEEGLATFFAGGGKQGGSSSIV